MKTILLSCNFTCSTWVAIITIIVVALLMINFKRIVSRLTMKFVLKTDDNKNLYLDSFGVSWLAKSRFSKRITK